MNERLRPPPMKSVAEILGDRYTPAFKDAFPDIDPGIDPFGYLILLQISMPKKKIGTIIVPDESKDAERWRVQTGLVRAMGPSAFKRRDTLEPWKEGEWCAVGDFVRCPMYGGDRWEVKIPGTSSDKALFLMVKDTDLIGLVRTDPINLITS